MFRINHFFNKKAVGLLLAITCLSTTLSASGETKLSFKKMKGIPTSEPGYSNGVSACFAGILQGKIVMAGGCNFPEEPVAKGGKKRFYKGIYVANRNAKTNLQWKKAGELPAPAAYGVTIEDNNRLIFIGGSNENGGLTSVFSLSFNPDQTIKTETLPALPCPIDNMAGAIIGKTIYVAGGKQGGKPSGAMWYLKLDKLAEGWKPAPSFPGNPRVQPVISAQLDCLYLWGGFSQAFDGNAPTISTDGYKFSPKTNQWTPLPSPVDEQGNTVTFGGGVSLPLNDSLILCTGGVNKDVFMAGLQREATLKGEEAKQKAFEYLSHSPEWYRFNDGVFIYNSARNCWSLITRNPAMARAGAALIGNNNSLFLINGETKPGIRSPQITKIKISVKKSNKPTNRGTK